MKNYKAIYFFALLAFMVIGCEEETPEMYLETSSTVIDDSRLSFNLDNFDDPVGAVKGNVEVLWDEYSTQIIEGQEWQEYKIKELRPRMYSQDSTGTYIGREKGYNYTLLATKTSGTPEFYLAKMVSYSHQEERSFFSLEENNFHGLLYLYTMRGVPAYIMHYEKGEVLNKIENLEVAQEVKQLSDNIATARCMEKASTVAKCDTALGCALSSGGSCGGGGSPAGSGWVAVPTHHYTDWYNVRSTGAEYSHTQYNGSSTEYIWVVGTTTTNAPPVRGSYTYATQSAGTVSYSGSPPKNVVANTNLAFVPPSCKSFNFKKVTSNWQEASVVNISFNVWVFEIVQGVRLKKKHLVSFPQPVKFGMPSKFYNGTVIPSGLAAEIGARAINHAIDDVISKYNKLVLNSTSVIKSDFQEFLKKEFRELSNGGRVNFNDTSSASIATEYQTYGVLKDNCY